MKKNLKKRILKQSGKFFSELGFFGASMGDIAKSLNITKAALYYHFKNKKELYLTVLNKAFQRLNMRMNKTQKTMPPNQRPRQLIESYLKWGKIEKNLIRIQMAGPSNIDPEIRKSVLRFRKKIEDQFAETFKNVLKKEVDLRLFASFLLGTMDRLILEAPLLNRKMNVKEKTSQILKALSPFTKVDSKLNIAGN